jgi:hypothetical protein
MVTMIVVDGRTNPQQRQHYQRSRRRRLPQHQVHAPKREVPYPASHPLGRHKLNLLHKQQQQQQIIDAWENDGSSSNPADRNTNIIAGDGSLTQQQQRQYERQQFRTKQQLMREGKHQQHRSQTEKQQQQHHRFLRYLGSPKSWGIYNDNSSGKSRRRRSDDIRARATNTAAEIPETMQEGQLLVESKDDTTTNTIMLRYWTISGRNLVTTTTSTSREAMHEQIMNYENEDENDSVASLLMDVHRIYDENEEAASSSSGSRSIGEEGDGTLSAEGQVIAGIESSIGNEEGGTADADNTAVNSITEDGNDPQYVADEGDDIDTIHSSSLSTSSNTTTPTTTSLYQPIRLRAILTDDDSSGSKYLTPSQRQILMEEIINPALFAWSQALHVVPVGGGADGGSETISGTASSSVGETTIFTTITNHQNLVVDQSQLYDSVSCGPGLDSGLPSVIVPEEHMTVGLADTDTVVYVSFAFADNRYVLEDE